MGRIALWLDPEDLRWLAARCCCGDDATKLERERCARLRFRANAALHKAVTSGDWILLDGVVETFGECEILAGPAAARSRLLKREEILKMNAPRFLKRQASFHLLHSSLLYTQVIRDV